MCILLPRFSICIRVRLMVKVDVVIRVTIRLE